MRQIWKYSKIILFTSEFTEKDDSKTSLLILFNCFIAINLDLEKLFPEFFPKHDRREATFDTSLLNLFFCSLAADLCLLH